MTTETAAPHIPTLMTVHAHPDDETIGTGGTMARAVADGQRVVLVTCTRGEMGEIVVPRWTRPTTTVGSARSGPASWNGPWAILGVTEWENLGYHDSDMMGRTGNLDPRSFWQADLDEAARRLVWLIRRYQPDVVTTYNDFGGYGHPDHIRTHDVAVRAFPAGRRPGLVPGAARAGARRDGSGRRGGRARAVDPVEALRAGHPRVRPQRRWPRRLKELGKPSFWAPPEDATPEQLAEFEAYMAKMLVPDEAVTTWVDISGAPLETEVGRHPRARDPDRRRRPFMLFGLEGWREAWSNEAYILRESTVETGEPEIGPVRRARLARWRERSAARQASGLTRAGGPSTRRRSGP